MPTHRQNTTGYYLIDADETVTEELSKSILSAKASDEPVFYKYNRLTNYCGKWIRHSGWYPDSKVRIFDRNKAKWTGQIHEKLQFDKDIIVDFLKGESLHYSYNSISEHIRKMNSFTDVAARELFEKGKRCSLFKLIFKTKLKFLSVYIWKLGFLDGYYGFVIAVLSAMSEFVKFSKLKNPLCNKERNKKVPKFENFGILYMKAVKLVE